MSVGDDSLIIHLQDKTPKSTNIVHENIIHKLSRSQILLRKKGPDMRWFFQGFLTLDKFDPTIPFFKKKKYLSFLTVVGLHYSMGSSLVVSRGYSLLEACRLLVVVASPVAEHRLWGTWASLAVACGLSSCSSAPAHWLSS